MALFPILDFESEVQVNDKTRLDGSKSFVSKGATAISTMTIKPGDDGSSISVYDSDSDLRYLDWMFSAFSIDIDSTRNKIRMSQSSNYNVSLTAGTYTLATLATEIATKLNAAGGTGTFSVSVDVDDKLTITNSTTRFTLDPYFSEDSVLPYIGFKTRPDGENDYENATSHEGDIVDKLPRNVTLTVGDGSTTASITKVVYVVSKDGDALFSSDQDLRKHEYDIMKWVSPGRATFLDVHRKAQDLIVSWLDEEGYVNIYNEKYTKFDIVDHEEVRQWSTYLALHLIFKGIHNSEDDVFEDKAADYEAEMIRHRNRAILRLDTDKDGRADEHERLDTSWSGTVVRR